MKKTVAVFLFFTIISHSYAQSPKTENMTTVWPFLYEKFADGTIYYNGGASIDAKLNIDMVRYKLNFFDTDDMVKEFSYSDNIDSVLIDNSIYLPVEDVFYELLASANDTYLLKKVKADISHLGTEGGYGSATSSAAVTRMTDLYVSNYQSLPISHMEFDIHAGESIPTAESYWIYSVTNKNLFRITKKSLKTEFPSKDSKAFIKTNKIKLKEDYDQLQLFNFLMQ